MRSDKMNGTASFRRRTALLVVSLLAILLSGPLVTPASRQVAFASIHKIFQAAKPREQMVPMRDGVKLATSIYLPQGNGPWPAVLVRTPYGKELQATGNSVWTNRQYALIVQDTRGRFKSEGEYRPFMTDHIDGYDTGIRYAEAERFGPPKAIQPWTGVKDAQVWGPCCPSPEQTTVSSDEPNETTASTKNRARSLSRSEIGACAMAP